MPRVRRLVLLLASLSALATAPAAQAAPNASVDVPSKTVTITGEDAGEALVVGDDGTHLTHNIASAAYESSTDFDADAGVQSVPDDGTYQLVVSTQGGDDSVVVETEKVLRVLADLGAGDDHYQGSTVAPGTADELDGGAGDDRIAGGRGADDMRGGDGNDTLVWNNGDGNDDMDGQGGLDSGEVNGSTLGADDFSLSVADGVLRLDRVNLALFNVLVTPATERFELNGHGGADKIASQPGIAALGMTLVLSGGTGDDAITGSDGGDAISGGDDVDTLAGGSGDDRIAGNRGNDTMAGGDGSDTLVWNNGDNTDKADGDGGFDVMEVNGAGAGDAFAVTPSGARSKFERTNLVPFSIDLATELLDVNGLGGDDTIAASGAPAVLLDLDGGAGNDALTGDAGHDSLRGGAGADRLTGGGGTDAIDGDDGDDTVVADDGQPDVVRCGAGADRAGLDLPTVDTAVDCEEAIRPLPGPTGPEPAKAGAVRIPTGKVTVAKLRAGIRLECPAGATTCQGRLTLTTPRAVRVGRVRVIVVLGSASYRIVPGTSATVTVKLTKALRAIAGRARTVRVAAVASSDAGGATTLVTTRTVTLTKRKRW